MVSYATRNCFRNMETLKEEDELDVKVANITSILPIKHSEQQSTWDCGLTCIYMLIQNEHKRIEFISNLENILIQERLQTSIWTIDLAYILKKIGIKFTYYTETIGVNQVFKNEPYYKNVLNDDRLRVTMKFDDAKLNNIHVFQGPLKLEKILNHLIENPALVLLDSNYIQCCEPNHNHLWKFWRIVRLKFTSNPSYQGHYVVLLGFNHSKRLIIYNDPNSNFEQCKMTYDFFEKARKSRGTDQDIILVNELLTTD